MKRVRHTNISKGWVDESELKHGNLIYIKMSLMYANTLHNLHNGEAREYEKKKEFFSKHIFALTSMSNSPECNASYVSQSTDAILAIHNVMGD
jgi:hypothetical protein